MAEDPSAERSTVAAIAALIELRPASARLLKGIETDTPIAAIRHGDLIVCRPGERIR